MSQQPTESELHTFVDLLQDSRHLFGVATDTLKEVLAIHEVEIKKLRGELADVRGKLLPKAEYASLADAIQSHAEAIRTIDTDICRTREEINLLSVANDKLREELQALRAVNEKLRTSDHLKQVLEILSVHGTAIDGLQKAAIAAGANPVAADPNATQSDHHPTPWYTWGYHVLDKNNRAVGFFSSEEQAKAVVAAANGGAS